MWEVRAEDRVLHQEVIEGLNVEVGEVKQIGTLQLGPYRLSRTRRIHLHVGLESEACRQEKPPFWNSRSISREHSGGAHGCIQGRKSRRSIP